MKTTRLIFLTLLLTGSILFAFGAYHLAGIGTDVTDVKETNENNRDNRASSIKWEQETGNSFNILFLGGDLVYNNTDTIILANINPETLKISLLSIPRDTRVIIEGKIRKINFAYPRGGGEMAVDTTERLLNTRIDYYVFTDLALFRKAIDLLGGVEYYIPEDMVYDDPTQNLHIRLSKGYQILDGVKAEYLVRYRKGYNNGDIGRIKVQQDFIKEVFRQKMTVANIPKLRNIIIMVFDSLKSNISIEKALRMFLIVERIDTSDLQFFRLPGDVDDRTWMFIADLEQASEIITRHFNVTG